jgi:hypothetical protein
MGVLRCSYPSMFSSEGVRTAICLSLGSLLTYLLIAALPFLLNHMSDGPHANFLPTQESGNSANRRAADCCQCRYMDQLPQPYDYSFAIRVG